jgi:hypothetical protein
MSAVVSESSKKRKFTQASNFEPVSESSSHGNNIVDADTIDNMLGSQLRALAKGIVKYAGKLKVAELRTEIKRLLKQNPNSLQVPRISSEAHGDREYHFTIYRSGQEDKQYRAFQSAFGYTRNYLKTFDIIIDDDVFGPKDISARHMMPRMVIDRLLAFEPKDTSAHVSIVLGHISQGIPSWLLNSGDWKLKLYYKELMRLKSQPGNCKNIECSIYRQDKYDLLWALSDDEPNQPILKSGFVLPTLKIPLTRGDKPLSSHWIHQVCEFMAEYGDDAGFILKTHNTTNSRNNDGRVFFTDPLQFSKIYTSFCKKYEKYMHYFFLQPTVENRKVKTFKSIHCSISVTVFLKYKVFFLFFQLDYRSIKLQFYRMNLEATT